MKKCKFCQSEIDDKAIVCPVCRRDLVETKETNTQTTTKNTSPIVFILVGVLTFAAVVTLVWYMGIT